ncbi:hypothetical protein IJT93_12715 [bacterium]|nr:hypothetical protein [bacterium]
MKNRLPMFAAALSAFILLLANPAAEADNNCKIPREKLGKISGRVQIVQENADYRVRVIKEGFPDMRVKLVNSAKKSREGEWQIVNYKPDFTIQYDHDNPDFTVMFVDEKPGVQP